MYVDSHVGTDDLVISANARTTRLYYLRSSPSIDEELRTYQQYNVHRYYSARWRLLGVWYDVVGDSDNYLIRIKEGKE